MCLEKWAEESPVEYGLLAERGGCCFKLGARQTSALWDPSHAGFCPATQELLLY